ncbi:MAG: patatin-like phospholipase family protein [Nanoarchaeales archaeon]|nr:patatin-like phospholipase family protein [Nanoarchaeales archaeon]
MFKKNQKTTLVLSGGGALGFVHFGVLKSLEQKQIKISEVIGTSFGAIAAAFLAIGHTCKEIDTVIEELHYLKLLKINIFSGNSLIEQTKIRKFLQEKFGDITLNQTKIEIKIIATNIETGKIKVFDKNSKTKLIDAICASISIPAIFKPYQIEDKVYVDGFLCSNLPFEFSSNKKIIAIDVITQKFVENFKYKYIPQIIEKSVNITILNQTNHKLEINKNKQLQRIEIDVENYKAYDFHKWKELIEIGEKEFDLKFKE